MYPKFLAAVPGTVKFLLFFLDTVKPDATKNR